MGAMGWALSTAGCAAGQARTADLDTVTAELEEVEEEDVVLEGTVSGLRAVGLVLEDQDGVAIALGKDGRFVFPNRVPAESAYRVTVSQQPASQHCEIEGGEGLATAPMAVAVTCADVPNALVGEVRGAVGHVLLANGEDYLSAGSGRFELPAVPVGATYDVVLVGTESLQRCTLEHAHGTMTHDEAPTILVECALPSPATAAE